MADVKYSREEVASRGEAIYEQDIRSHIESKKQGQYLVLDIETGDYEIDPDDLVATKRVLAKRPNAVLYGLRIGHSAAYRLTRSSHCGFHFGMLFDQHLHRSQRFLIL